MSLSRSQVTTTSVDKEQLYFCIVAMKNPKLKFKIPFGIAPKNKHRDNVTKEMKALYTENCKILLRNERPK